MKYHFTLHLVLWFSLQKTSMKSFDPQLVAKYNVAGPRYTSYPTVPYWDKATFSTDGWLDSLNIHADKASSNEISLYIHLPFCESMCTFCGCTKRITKNHTLEIPYINAVLKELQLYLDQLSFQPVIKPKHFDLHQIYLNCTNLHNWSRMPPPTLKFSKSNFTQQSNFIDSFREVWNCRFAFLVQLMP